MKQVVVEVPAVLIVSATDNPTRVEAELGLIRDSHEPGTQLHCSLENRRAGRTSWRRGWIRQLCEMFRLSASV